MEPMTRALKEIVYKACVVAVWSDNSMAVDEKRYLAYLNEMFSEDEEERDTLHQLRGMDFDVQEVLAEIKTFSKQERFFIFGKCLEVLTCDHRITGHEMQFLEKLRTACGIGSFQFRRLYNDAVRQYNVRLSFKYKVVIAFNVIIAACVFVFLGIIASQDYEHVVPKAKCSGEEITTEVLKGSVATAGSHNNGEQVYECIKKGIVSVNVLCGSQLFSRGSGFVLGTDNSGLVYVVTNKHVVDCEVSKFSFKDTRIHFEVVPFMKARFDATLDYCSTDHDLAILSVKELKEYVTPLKMRTKKDLRVGQDVYALGSPLGLKDSLTRGIISALREDSLQTDATISYGSSGGPLVDQEGVLCAVMYGAYKMKDFSFGIYTDAIVEMLEKRKLLCKNGK